MSAEKALEESLKKQRASLEIQRQAIQRQPIGNEKLIAIDAAEQFMVPMPAANEADCPALDSSKVNELVTAAAQKQSLEPALLRSVMKQESGFKPCAVSVKGAQGLMQLMPATARELHVTDAFNPVQNVQAGAAYLRQLLDRYNGDVGLALVGYNAGPGRADQTSGAPYPVETQNYVATILADLGIDPPEHTTAQEDLAPSWETADQITTPTISAPSKVAIVPPLAPKLLETGTESKPTGPKP